jgi:RNA polymerase sigma-70 factor (ECF subfamily)
MATEIDLPDAVLMGHVAAGEREAVSVLLDRHGGALLRFLRRAAPTRADADDIFQEVWLRVVRSARAYDPAQRFTSWLFTIAWNRLRDHWRRHNARLPGREDGTARLERATCPGAGAEAQLIEAEQNARVRQLIGLLPAKLAEAIWLRYFEELSEKEMAARLGVPAGTVKSRLHDGVQRLTPLVKDER